MPQVPGALAGSKGAARRGGSNEPLDSPPVRRSENAGRARPFHAEARRSF